MSKQVERLKNHLMLYGSINPLESWLKLGIYRLSDVIFKLRKQGIKIETELTDVSNQFDEKCRVAKYVLVNPFTELP